VVKHTKLNWSELAIIKQFEEEALRVNKEELTFINILAERVNIGVGVVNFDS